MSRVIGNISRRLGKKIILPFYHLVSDQDCPHIRHLYPIKRIQKFEKELDFFQQYYEPLSLEDIIRHALHGTEPDNPSFFLSFDDGLKECKTIIAPILEKRHLKAAFFINTGFINNKALFYRYKVSLLIDNLGNRKASLSQKELLQLTYFDTPKINQFANEIGVNFDNFLKTQTPYMNESEIVSLKDSGHYIGAHSIDHPLYSLLTFEEQLRQTSQSLNELNQMLHLNYHIFSFPFTDDGVSSDFFKRIYEDKIVNLSFGTAGIKDDEYPFNLQRLTMDICTGSVQNFILQNSIAYQIKRLISRNKVQHF